MSINLNYPIHPQIGSTCLPTLFSRHQQHASLIRLTIRQQDHKRAINPLFLGKLYHRINASLTSVPFGLGQLLAFKGKINIFAAFGRQYHPRFIIRLRMQLLQRIQHDMNGQIRHQFFKLLQFRMQGTAAGTVRIREDIDFFDGLGVAHHNCVLCLDQLRINNSKLLWLGNILFVGCHRLFGLQVNDGP